MSPAGKSRAKDDAMSCACAKVCDGTYKIKSGSTLYAALVLSNSFLQAAHVGQVPCGPLCTHVDILYSFSIKMGCVIQIIVRFNV
jgi:hypothetical protein